MREDSQAGLRVLITNNSLDVRGGSELYARDIATSLMRRGHFPVAFSTVLGDVARDLRQATVPVISDLTDLNAVPDVVHGHHHMETMMALMTFPDSPAVFVCHGWSPWIEMPPLHPNIRRYVAVDDLCRERLLTSRDLDASKIETIYNFVDMDRFVRRPPLPPRPGAALIFSNYAGSEIEGAVREACRAVGVERVDVAGHRAGNPIERPEDLLPQYDVVFAKARAALEAMATGCAVIVLDNAGLGGMVTSDNVNRMRPLNFGIRTMQRAPLSVEAIVAELRRYDGRDAAVVSDFIRKTAGMAPVVARWEALYAEAIRDWREYRQTVSDNELRHRQMAACASYLAHLAPVVKSTGVADPYFGSHRLKPPR